MMAEAVEDSVGRRRRRQRMTTGVDEDCSGGQQRHASLGGGLQCGRVDGGKQCRREQSGNDGCNSGRRWWQTTTADNGG